jgi:hypothetical protein
VNGSTLAVAPALAVAKQNRNGPRPGAAWATIRFAGAGGAPLLLPLLLLVPLLLPLLLLVPLLLPLLLLPSLPASPPPVLLLLVQPDAIAPDTPNAVIAEAIPSRTIVTFRIAFSFGSKA